MSIATRPYADLNSKSGRTQAILEGGAVITRDALAAVAEGLRLVPAPFVAEAVSTLLKIWSYVQLVEVSLDSPHTLKVLTLICSALCLNSLIVWLCFNSLNDARIFYFRSDLRSMLLVLQSPRR